jgi:transposase
MWRSGQAYSQDLRERVLRAIDQGAKAAEVAGLFKVSVSYIYKALIRRRSTGEQAARPQRSHRSFKLAPLEDAIRAEVLRRPDATLEELRRWLAQAHQVEVSLGAMHNTLRRLGLTLKKSRGGRKSKTGPSSPDAGRSGDASSDG